jgi:hypothetical protein
MPDTPTNATGKQSLFGMSRPSVRDYSILALTALLLILPLLAEEGFDVWAFLPLLIGAIGILLSWSIGPGLVVLGLMIMLLVQKNELGPIGMLRPDTFTMNVFLPLLTLVYFAGATRLLTLQRHAVPPDVRRSRLRLAKRIRGRWLLAEEPTTRSSATIPAGEIVLLLMTAPVFFAIAYLIRAWIGVLRPPAWYDLPPWLWPIVVLIWAGTIVLALIWAYLAYIGRTLASEEESLLFLQDQLWAETRGEQRQINRAVAWTRLRRQKKEEKR